MHTTQDTCRLPRRQTKEYQQSRRAAQGPERGVPDDDLRAAEQCSVQADHRQGQHHVRDRKGAMLNVCGKLFFLHLEALMGKYMNCRDSAYNGSADATL